MQRSLILVTVDCLRADHVGWLGYDRPTTPFLDSLAAESVSFSNAIVAGSPTYYSFPAIMASRYPLTFGRDVIGLVPNETTLASTLNNVGFATAAFVAANPYLSARFGYGTGFDVFRDFSTPVKHPFAEKKSGVSNFSGRLNKTLHKMSRRSTWSAAIYDELYFQYCQRVAGSFHTHSLEESRPYPSADVVVQEACSWLQQNAGRSVFLWLHLMDPHSPYSPKPEALAAMGDSKLVPRGVRYLNASWNRSDLNVQRLKKYRDKVLCLYDAGVRWADTQLAGLVSALRELGLWNECVFAVTADHGEEFLEHGRRYHSPSQLGEEVIRVPLLLHFPRMSLPSSIHSPFSLIHLSPTVLDGLGVSIPTTFRGRSAWQEISTGQLLKGAAVVEAVVGCDNPFRRESRLKSRILVIREERYKLVIDFGSSEVQLFDLASDPHELKALPTNAKIPARQRLLRLAHEHLANLAIVRDSEASLAARMSDFKWEWANPAGAQPA